VGELNVRLGGLFAFSAALACCGSANAQAVAPTGDDRFALEVRGHVAYETNVAGGDKLIAAIRGLEPKDTTYSLGSTVALQLPSGRRRIYLIASADFDRHQKNDVLDGDNYVVSAGGDSQFGACDGALAASYAHRLALIQDITAPVAKNVADQETANLSVTCGRRGIVVGGNAGVSKVDNNAKGASFIDSTTRDAGASLGYQNKVFGTMSLTWQYSEVDYQNPPVSIFPTAHGFSQNSVGVNYSRKIGSRLSGNAGVNYTTLSSSGTSLSSDSWGADVDLNYRVSPRLGLTLVYSLGNEASAAADAAYVRAETFRFSGAYKLNSRINVQAAIQNSNDKYKGGRPSILQIRESEDWLVSGGVAVKIGRKVSLNFDASHIDRKADLSQYNYRSDRVSVGIIGTF
jgi:hypothetical protein